MAGHFLSNRVEFRITGITPFGLLSDASGVRGLLADLRGEILAVQADSVAPVNTPTPPIDAASDGTSFRDRRRSRLAEGHRRHEILSAAAPSSDPQFINAIAAADRFWGPDEQWREALQYQHVEPADVDITVGTPQVAAAKSRIPGLDRKQEPPRRLLPSLAPFRQPGQRPAAQQQRPRPKQTAAAEQPFDVPLPGRPPRRVGRARSWITRLALIGAPLVLVGGLAYSCGVSAGSARLVQSSAISADDAAAFHLSTFPAERAAALGVSYLSLCWTHPDAADTVATTDRLAALARMTSSGVSPGCGWTGSTASPPPLAVTWDGTVKATQGAYADGVAALLGFVVTAADGRTVAASVPIWVSSTTATSAGVRVVGDVAVLPIPPAAAAPTPAAPQLTDSAIAESVTSSVLVPFLRAWAVSDPVQLNLVLARDASGAARAGLAGQVSTPTVNRTQVVVTRGDPTNYRDGDLIVAQVGVDWTTRLGGIQRSGYSVFLRMTAGRWQIYDITGAAPDPAGGAAPATTFATTPTTAPTAG